MNRTLLLLTHLLAASAARAAETAWTGDPTKVLDWQSSNWSAGLPNATTDANISNGGTVSNRTGSTFPNLYLGKLAGESGNLQLSRYSGFPFTATNAYVGHAGTGAVLQRDPVSTTAVATFQNLYLGYTATGAGTYTFDELFGGGLNQSLNTTNLYVGYSGSGVFNHLAGRVATGGIARIGPVTLGYNAGATGTYTLARNASLAANPVVGRAGTGEFTTDGYLEIRDLAVGQLPGSNGTFRLTGGSITTQDRYASSVTAYVGYDGNGTFIQTGGKNMPPDPINSIPVNLDLTLGRRAGSSGAYQMQAGTLHAKSFTVGHSGAGSVAHTGGTVTVAPPDPTTSNDKFLYLGRYAGSTGSYSISGNASLLVNGSDGLYQVGIQVGYLGAGSFTQDGGTVQLVGASLAVGYNSGAGSYALNAGSLAANTTRTGSFETFPPASYFRQTGGTHTLTQLLEVAPTTLPDGAYQLAGGQLTAPTIWIGSVSFANPSRFTQTGGTASATGTVTIGNRGTYHGSAGSFTAGQISSAGALVIDGATVAAASVTGAFGTTTVTAGSLTVGGTLTQKQLAVSGTGTVTLNAAPNLTLAVSALSIADAATLDLSRGRLRVNYAAGAAPAPSPAAQIAAAIARAYDRGTWGGSGLTSTRARLDTTHATALAYADDGAALTVRYTWLGDLDLDGLVTSADAQLLETALTLPDGPRTWSQGDLNYDGRLTPDDLSLFSLGAASAAGQNISTRVPEPTCAITLITATTSLQFLPRARRRRRPARRRS